MQKAIDRVAPISDEDDEQELEDELAAASSEVDKFADYSQETVLDELFELDDKIDIYKKRSDLSLIAAEQTESIVE
jgi:hypothetical protein